MKRRSNRAFLVIRFISLFFIFSAIVLLGLQLVSYSRLRSTFPSGMRIAEVSVGGLTQQQAADRVSQIYSLPVEIYYQDAVFQISPKAVGFSLDLEGMLTAADMQRLDQPFWSAFWDYLWGRLPQPSPIPLRAEISKDRLKAFLANEIAPRYDKEAQPALSMSGSADFQSSIAGTQIDFDRSLVLIESALSSATNRSTTLVYTNTNAPRPSLAYLEALLKRNIELSEFDGIAEIYYLDLTTRDELHFATRVNEPLTPDIAFTAASTMKIPILVSTFIQQDLPLNESVANNIVYMIEQSENDPTDQLMDMLGGNLGPLNVTQNMMDLGFKNTFIAGFYYFGAPLLQTFRTPSNQRTDVNVSPDPYNQTVSSEIGMLLDDIYQCASSGGGSLVAVYGDQITQGECQQMLSYLANNRIGVLLQAGLPDGTRIAHKHGWITETDGLIHTMSDVGIVYSPGGNYVVCIFLWHPNQLYFDDANILFADLSKIIYNYTNLE